MEITYYLLQYNSLGSIDDDVELLNDGYLINTEKHSYYINFYCSQEDALAAQNKAHQYSSTCFRYQENELNSHIIDCLKNTYKDIDKQWLAELYEDTGGTENLEERVSEYMLAEYGDGFFNYDDIVEKAKEIITEKYLSEYYKVVPISKIGSSIKLTGIKMVLKLLTDEPGLKKTYPGLFDKLMDYEAAAEKTKATMSLLDVDGTDFANIYQVADKNSC